MFPPRLVALAHAVLRPVTARLMGARPTARKLAVGLGAVALLGVVCVSVVNAIPAVHAISAILAVAPSKGSGQPTPVANKPVRSDVSAPLRSIKPKAPSATKKERDHQLHPVKAPANQVDPVVQTRAPTGNAPTPGLNFAGLGNGDYGFTVTGAPPDTEGTVGATQYVQWVNTSFAVFNKSTGALVYGPAAGNTLWTGFGGGCEFNNDGDPIAQYDKAANRWVLTQFSVSTTPFLQCIAISTSPDATGSYFRYAYQFANFNDYPKLGIWHDGYYISFNLFNGNTFVGVEVCALPRANMLVGSINATGVCFQLSSAYFSLLPADLDGSIAPPVGAPNYLVGIDYTTVNTLDLWRFHVDYITIANSTFTGQQVPVAAFNFPCGGTGGVCVPQPGTTNQLDTLGDRVMYRLAYRRFGDGHESLAVNHTVDTGTTLGVRWYELQNPGGTPTVTQQSTYAPDSTYRWMGGIAMDSAGDMALGFSVSSNSLHPGIHYTGRLTGDPLGQMTQGENSLIEGSGSQTGTLTRWGDYSAMTVDPVDDCTFWYTNEYLPADGTFNWKTRIGSFKFANCNGFSMGASPASVAIPAGSSRTVTITTAATGGTPPTVGLSAFVAPSGPTASVNPTSVTAGGSATLTVQVGPLITPGNYTITVVGSAGSSTHTALVRVQVTLPSVITNGGFEGGDSLTGNLNGWATSGFVGPNSYAHTGKSAALTGATIPTNGGSSLRQTFMPTSATPQLAFWYLVTCPDTVANDWATATVTDNTAATTTTVLPKTCTNTGAWTLVTADLSTMAGHSVTLTLTNHDDNVGGNATCTLFDDVALGPRVINPVVNWSFEGSGLDNRPGSLTGWTTAAPASISTTPHTGRSSAMVGATVAFTGDSSIQQTFTIPAGASTLSFWYQVHCTGAVSLDWATATLHDNTASTTTTVLANTCTNTGQWVMASTNVAAIVGHSVTLTLISHDDGNAVDPIYTLYDDVVVS